MKIFTFLPVLLVSSIALCDGVTPTSGSVTVQVSDVTKTLDFDLKGDAAKVMYDFLAQNPANHITSCAGSLVYTQSGVSCLKMGDNYECVYSIDPTGAQASSTGFSCPAPRIGAGNQ